MVSSCASAFDSCGLSAAHARQRGLALAYPSLGATGGRSAGICSQAREAALADALRIRLLGGFHVTAGESDVPPSAWRLRKARTLVKILALEPTHRLHR